MEVGASASEGHGAGAQGGPGPRTTYPVQSRSYWGGGGIFQARNPCPGHKRDPQALDALDELGIDFVEDTLIRARIIQRQPVHCSAAVLPGG